jgi:hypothetical protein
VGFDVTPISLRSEAFARGARMLRTALGPAIASYLEDPSIVEVMLNPDGRLWLDRLSGGLEDTGHRVTPADAERIVRLVAHHGVDPTVVSPAAKSAQALTKAAGHPVGAQPLPEILRIQRLPFIPIFGRPIFGRHECTPDQCEQ